MDNQKFINLDSLDDLDDQVIRDARPIIDKLMDYQCITNSVFNLTQKTKLYKLQYDERLTKVANRRCMLLQGKLRSVVTNKSRPSVTRPIPMGTSSRCIGNSQAIRGGPSQVKLDSRQAPQENHLQPHMQSTMRRPVESTNFLDRGRQKLILPSQSTMSRRLLMESKIKR